MGGSPNLPQGERTFARYFDTSVFAAPAAFSLGNAGRTLVEGPENVRFDIASGRTAAITERVSIEFRADTFKVLNHPNITNPNTTLGSRNFGIVSSKSGNPQISVRISPAVLMRAESSLVIARACRLGPESLQGSGRHDRTTPASKLPGLDQDLDSVIII